MDTYIKYQTTGTPNEFADKLEMSERAVYKYLKFMKEELLAPIEYSKLKMTYFYIGEGEFKFKWKR